MSLPTDLVPDTVKPHENDSYVPDVFSGFYENFGKRCFDIVLTLLIAIPALVIVIAIALIMLFSHEGKNIFFGHRRIGKDGEAFKCWKIRTMVVDAEQKLQDYLAANPDAAEQWTRDHKLDRDPRITRIGRFLRKSSLDELPQLWNVFKGEMSFVGPRPVVRMEMHKYGRYRKTYMSVRPGVTGLWQVSGRNGTTYAERVQLDVDYVRNMSLLGDIRLVFQTFRVLVQPTGK
ncbi:sugar transferase [uncultured Pelagimonas sp.]|uniref:sugar transferase n=1 Tax=uncultured Pelagimonas sp. TaxID=1618102 RepID=UPI0026115435|nr:sugar transferase [uncultured Pelagimonas sp.]